MEDNKTFTQEEVNAIVQDRLAKEKAKYEKQIADLQADVNRREKRLNAVDLLKQKELPAELIDLVDLKDEDSMNNSIALLDKTYKQQHGADEKPGYTPAGGRTHYVDPIRSAMGL